MEVDRFKLVPFGITAILLLSLLAPSHASAQQIVPIQPEQLNNNGQDPTRTVRRLDLRYQYQLLPSHTNNNVNTFTLRGDDVLRLNDRWRISGRLELPLLYTDRFAPGGTDGSYTFGLGDIVAQTLAIYDVNERTAVAVGTQLIFPSASEKNLGSDQWQLGPTVVARWMLPEISLGSFFAPALRYRFDFAGSNPVHTSTLQFSPSLNVSLPDLWFVTLFPGTSAGGDILYNLGRSRPGDKGRLFLPADLMLGKMLGPATVASLELGVPIINDSKTRRIPGTYDFKIEARIGFFFR